MERTNPARAPETRRPAGEAGFSLLEVMVAMVLMVIGLLAVAAAQLHSLRFAVDSDNRSQAMYLAEEQLGRLLSLNTTHPILTAAGPQLDPGNPITLAGFAQGGNAPGVGETMEYCRVWVVEQPPVPGLPPGMRRVTVTVGWKTETLSTTTCNPANLAALAGTTDLRVVKLVGLR